MMMSTHIINHSRQTRCGERVSNWLQFKYEQCAWLRTVFSDDFIDDSVLLLGKSVARYSNEGRAITYDLNSLVSQNGWHDRMGRVGGHDLEIDGLGWW
jgi:hypothetical protein